MICPELFAISYLFDRLAMACPAKVSWGGRLGTGTGAKGEVAHLLDALPLRPILGGVRNEV